MAARALSYASRIVARPSGVRFASVVKPEALAQASGLPGTYASSAYQAAANKSESVLDAFEADLNNIRGQLTSSPELRDFVTNPTLSAADKQKGLDALLSSTNEKKTEGITRNFLGVLVENGRLTDLERILEQFKAIMSAHRGEINITITSAKEMDNSSRSRLEKTLKGSETVKKGQSVKFAYTVNETLLGGLIVDFGERSIDLSVSNKVNKINHQLAQSV